MFMYSLFLICLVAAAVTGAAVTDPPPRPGGFKPIPSNDPHLQPSVSFAAANVNRRCNCAFCQTVVGVSHAMEKVVSGWVYDFTMTLQESDKCVISKCYDNVTSSDCPPNPKARAYDCHATVLSHPWVTPPMVLQNLTCEK